MRGGGGYYSKRILQPTAGMKLKFFTPIETLQKKKKIVLLIIKLVLNLSI